MTIQNDAVQLRLHTIDPEQVSPVIAKAVPFVKWAGGKRRLLGLIAYHAPTTFKRYIEPFVGGGAIALGLGYRHMLLNDANAELMNAYRIVRDDLNTLLLLLDEHQKKHSKDYFYQMRAQDPHTLSLAVQAARFIYLNKTCFNGLYRVNKHGAFNVPFGKYKMTVLYDRERIQEAAEVLSHAELFAQDYHSFLMQHVQPGDFVYLDPPYVPISQYSDFKRYTKEQFRENDQYTLARVYDDLIAAGAYPILSNSYSELTLELYAQHRIQIVHMSRNINHEGTGRNPIPEILVVPRQRI